MSNFAERLNLAMKERKISPAELSRESGIVKASISQYLASKNEPRGFNVKKLANALNVNEDWLVGKNVPMEGEIKKEPEKNMSIAKAAALLDKSAQFVRIGLQRGILPFGYAVKMGSCKWTYHISPAKFYEYAGIKTEGGVG